MNCREELWEMHHATLRLPGCDSIQHIAHGFQSKLLTNLIDAFMIFSKYVYKSCIFARMRYIVRNHFITWNVMFVKYRDQTKLWVYQIILRIAIVEKCFLGNQTLECGGLYRTITMHLSEISRISTRELFVSCSKWFIYAV